MTWLPGVFLFLRKEDSVRLMQNGSELFYSGKQGVLRSSVLLASWFGGGLAWFLLLLLFVFLLLLSPEVFSFSPSRSWS